MSRDASLCRPFSRPKRKFILCRVTFIGPGEFSAAVCLLVGFCRLLPVVALFVVLYVWVYAEAHYHLSKAYPLPTMSTKLLVR